MWVRSFKNECDSGCAMKTKINSFASLIETHKHWGTFFSRIGIAAIFLWFGLDKFVHATNWIGWVPDWMITVIPISLEKFMYVQGGIETLVGILLVVGYKVRFASLLAVITLLGVELAMLGSGQTQTMLRDL